MTTSTRVRSLIPAFAFAILVSLGTGPPTLRAQARSTADRADSTRNPNQLHLLYVVAMDRQDHQLDRRGILGDSAERALRWLEAQTGRTVRLDRYRGAPDVSFVRLDATDREIRRHEDPVGFVEWQLVERGLLRPGKLYAAYFEGHFDDCAAAAQPPALLGQVALLAIGDPRCGPPLEVSTGVDHWELTLIHEVFHLLGAVAPSSPHADSSGHLLDNTMKDLMTSGSWDPPDLLVDRSQDDYWGHGSSDFVDISLSVFLEPSAPGAELPPAWPLQRLTPLARVPQPQPVSDSEASIGIVNLWDQDAVLYRKDESTGALVFEASLETTHAHYPGSLVGDVWVLTRPRDQAPLAAWVAPAGLSLAIFTKP